MSSTRYFSPKLFAFLRDLEANNDRAWFKENKDRYEANVKEPALDFVNAFDAPLRKISKHFVADSRGVGGSLFRIHRDTRFSKDKTPYKTHTGMQFRHELAKDVHAPGFYLHLQPGQCYAGVGLWMPETAVARQIREAIDADQARWKRVTRGKRFTDVLTFGDHDQDKLRRPPAGYDADHPLIEDLKLKSFTAGTRIKQSVVTGPDFLDEYARICKAGAPFVHFICDAVGVPF